MTTQMIKLVTDEKISIFVSGECTFKKSWHGEWFQYGVQTNLYINSTFIETKGICHEKDGDKYLVYEK